MHEARVVVIPVWVSLEGVNGVGKTRLASHLAERLTGRARTLSELTDGGGDPASSAVIAALSSDRSFLRTGHPLTETMALLALKVRERERVAALTDPPEIVIEDRGIDTVALYQAVIGSGNDDTTPDDVLHAAAERVYAAAAPWLPMPDLTVLLRDDIAACERRFAERDGRPPAQDERRIIAAAGRLYLWRAASEPGRIRTIDRSGLDIADVLDTVVELLDAAVDSMNAAGSMNAVGGVR